MSEERIDLGHLVNEVVVMSAWMVDRMARDLAVERTRLFGSLLVPPGGGATS